MRVAVGRFVRQCSDPVRRFARSGSDWVELEDFWSTSHYAGDEFRLGGMCCMGTCASIDSLTESTLRYEDTGQVRGESRPYFPKFRVFEVTRVEDEMRVVIPAYDDAACEQRRDVEAVIDLTPRSDA